MGYPFRHFGLQRPAFCCKLLTAYFVIVMQAHELRLIPLLHKVWSSRPVFTKRAVAILFTLVTRAAWRSYLTPYHVSSPSGASEGATLSPLRRCRKASMAGQYRFPKSASMRGNPSRSSTTASDSHSA